MFRNQPGRLGMAVAIAGCSILTHPASTTAQELVVRRVNDGNVVLDGVPAVPLELGERLRRYENVRSASFASWAAGGRGLYVVTWFGETSQLHKVDMPRGARSQLTFLSEPVTGAERRPGTSELLFGMDEAGCTYRDMV